MDQLNETSDIHLIGEQYSHAEGEITPEFLESKQDILKMIEIAKTSMGLNDDAIELPRVLPANPDEMETSCYIPYGNIIFLHPEHYGDVETFAHELGHFFRDQLAPADAKYLKNDRLSGIVDEFFGELGEMYFRLICLDTEYEDRFDCISPLDFYSNPTKLRELIQDRIDDMDKLNLEEMDDETYAAAIQEYRIEAWHYLGQAAAELYVKRTPFGVENFPELCKMHVVDLFNNVVAPFKQRMQLSGIELSTLTSNIINRSIIAPQRKRIETLMALCHNYKLQVLTALMYHV